MVSKEKQKTSNIIMIYIQNLNSFLAFWDLKQNKYNKKHQEIINLI